MGSTTRKRKPTSRSRSTDRATGGGSPEEAKARAWLKAHSNDPLVAGAALPSDHRRDPETGESLHNDRAAGTFDLGAAADGRKHRAEVSYSKWETVQGWEEFRLPTGKTRRETPWSGSKWNTEYAPVVGRGGMTPEQLDKRIRVDRVLAQLKPQQAELLRRRFVEQQTLEAIAAEDGCTYQSVQGRLETAIQDFVRSVGETWAEPYDLLGEVFG